MDANVIWVVSGIFYISWLNLACELLLALISYVNSVLTVFEAQRRRSLS
jgi:hypothetical protein